MKKQTIATLLAACFTFATSISAAAPNDALEQERQQNLRMSNASNPRAEVFYKRGKLGNEQHKDYTVNLKAGRQYGIYSDCKEVACRNLDMDLLFKGTVIESDTEDDTYPLFTFTPETTGQYTIRTQMTKCLANQCEYHVHVVEEKKD